MGAKYKYRRFCGEAEVYTDERHIAMLPTTERAQELASALNEYELLKAQMCAVLTMAKVGGPAGKEINNQLERVAGKYRPVCGHYRENILLRIRLSRLVKALRYYALPQIYEIGVKYGGEELEIPVVDRDRGYMARRAIWQSDIKNALFVTRNRVPRVVVKGVARRKKTLPKWLSEQVPPEPSPGD